MASGGHPKRRRSRATLALTIGNWFELYDFTLFSYFSSTLAGIFFPASSPAAGLFLTLLTFGIGFAARPLGAVLFGVYADRYGRKPAVTGTILLMTAGTAVLAFCPGYQTIGVFAPMILTLGRLLQGLGIGGEIGPSTTLLMEVARPGRQIFHVSLQNASQGAAALSGAITGLILNHVLSPETIAAGAWRFPFVLGLLVGPVGMYLRASLAEKGGKLPRPIAPLASIVVHCRRQVLCGALILLSGTSSMYVVVFFMPTYLMRMMGLPPETAYLTGCVAGMVLLVGAPLAGALADRYDACRLFVLASSVAGAILVLPAFHVLTSGAPLPVLLLVVAILVAFTALGSGTGLTYILSSFPRPLRATGLAIVYSFAVSIFGGFAQMIVTWLIAVTGDPTAPAWYVAGCCAVSVVGVVLLQPARDDVVAPAIA